MEYKDLHELIRLSSSSRSFFLSLPTEIQCRLHTRAGEIKNARQLHKTVYAEYDTMRLYELSRQPLIKKKNYDL